MQLAGLCRECRVYLRPSNGRMDANFSDVQRSELLTVSPAASCYYTTTMQEIGILYIVMCAKMERSPQRQDLLKFRKPIQ